MQTFKLIKKYEKYSEYKDSGVEWLGKIPKGWNTIKFKQILDYVQPSDYISDEILEMRDENSVPVLTANKAFILGYTQNRVGTYENLPVIIFDDFTTDKKFVDFPFKVRSSALKIIKPRNSDFDFKYVFRVMEGLKSPILEHNRHWISVYSQYKIPIPTLVEQKKITQYLDEKTFSINQIIEKKEKQIEILKEEIVSVAMNEQINGKGNIVRMINLIKTAQKPIELDDYSEYTALGLYNRSRGLFHKEPQLGKDIKESDFYKVMPRDLIISGQFAWEGAVTLAGKSESECVVSHRYYLLRDGVIKTEYLLALLMTKFGDHILNEASRGSAGRNRPLNIKILLKEKIRVPSKEAEKKIESLLIKMDLIRNNIKKTVNLLDEYKFSLIFSVVTGKVKI